MECQKLQKNLISYVSGEISDDQKRVFESHLAQCPFCKEEVRELGLVWNLLDSSPDRTVPKNIEARILSAAREAVVTVNENIAVNSWASLKGLLQPMAPIGMGLAAAIVSAGILSSKMNLSLIHPLGLTAVGALWTGLYSVIFYLLFSPGKREASSWRSFAQASLVAVGIFLIFTAISPVPSSLNFCRYYSFTQPVIERLSTGGSFFLFGALYALIPMSIAAYFSGNRTGHHPFAKASMAGVMFAALLAPSIYLQCAPFALGVLLVWFGGALVGSVLGGLIGHWVRYRFAWS